ncbi:alpha-galactosidase [Planktotalea sp.]|uniref:alpha-galactosidase n=1 Tax=Planktotalea sp. TaxID=2029877 RepID=UPI003298EE5E
MKQWRLDCSRQTLVLASLEERLPQVIYWGDPLPMDEDLATLQAAHGIDVTGGMLDENPDLSICPEAARTFPGQAGLSLRSATGALILPLFRFESVDANDAELSLRYRDADNGLNYIARFAVDAKSHIITAQAFLEADSPVHLNWLSAPVFPASQHSAEMIDFAGRWCGEFLPNKTPWSAGIRMRESRTGRTGHEHFPGLIVPNTGTSNTKGAAQAFHYGWSGGHKMIAEELPDGRRQIQFGNASETELSAGTTFQSAPLYATYSNEGINGCAIAFQRHVRDEIVSFPDTKRPRPVHYNCWEAIYFDHDLDALKDIANRAADLGAERFVLDDGWFGMRDDDTSSLGDWAIDPRKYPDGLGPLIDHIHNRDMTFGIWFEPEMVNPDSDIYRAHPDWALGASDQILGRQQMVLNMALPEVREYLYDHIAAVLSAYPVDYIKWDHNRVLPTPDAAQTRGTYALLERLRNDFPSVEIESCASGGGRIDFGILKQTHRVWLSDSNDALERLRMQHEAALFLPSVVTGSHVGPRKCHTSSRELDISIRAWVAAQRHMGFEMDPRELTEHETSVLKEVTQWWKDNRNWMADADILRLDSPDPAVIAEQQLATDGTRFVLFAGKAATSAQIQPRPLRLACLEPNAQYEINLLNKADAPALSRGAPILKDQKITLSGSYLMSHGITLPWTFPDTMWVIEGRKC